MTPFRDLPRNARSCILVEPLWALFGPLVMFYAPLYQKARGLSALDMGVINSTAIATGFLFFLLGAPLANRFGRRMTSLVFDVIAWSVAMVVWAFARSFTVFIIAGVLNSCVRVVIISWNLLITEDAQPGQRSTIHGWMHLIGSTGGLVTFMGGLAIARFGILESMPVIYLVGAASMTLMFILRHLTTRETATGLMLMEKTKTRPLLADIAAQLRLTATVFHDRGLALRVSIFTLANMVYAMDYYRVLYLGEAKRLSPSLVAFVPALGATFSIIVFFFVLPRLEAYRRSRNGDGHEARALAAAALFCIGAVACFIVSPSSFPALPIVASALMQTGYFLVLTYRDTTFMNGTDSLKRSGLYGVAQALAFLISIPAGWLGGFLYSRNPALPFVGAGFFYAFCFLAARSIDRTDTQRANRETRL